MSSLWSSLVCALRVVVGGYRGFVRCELYVDQRCPSDPFVPGRISVPFDSRAPGVGRVERPLCEGGPRDFESRKSGRCGVVVSKWYSKPPNQTLLTDLRISRIQTGEDI